MNRRMGARRLAALTSGALMVGGLVAAPALGGIATASADSATLDYTCTLTYGSAYDYDSTFDIDVTVPEKVMPGAVFSAAVAISLDMGSHTVGPVDKLTGSVDVPLSIGGTTTVVTVPIADATPPTMLFAGSASTSLTAPTALGSAPITAGDPTANVTAYVGGAPFSKVSIPCAPDAGQDHTVAQTTVSEDAPYVPEGILYHCTYGSFPNVYDAYVDLDADLPASIDQASGYNPEVDATISWSDEAAEGFRSLGLGVEDGSGALNLTSTFGQGEQTSDIALSETDVPAEGHVVWTGSGSLGVLDTSVPGEQTLAVGDGEINLNATVKFTPGVYTPATFECTVADGEDTEIGTTTVNQVTQPVSVTGKVSIKGTAKVGKTLTAVPGKAAGAKIKYQWFANNKAIKKATANKLKLTKALKGKKVKVQATYSKKGSYDVVQTSKAVKVKK